MSHAAAHQHRALVVYESMFGNTEQVAHAVSEALSAAGYLVDEHDVADPDVPTGPLDHELVVVGAPTHAFSLSRPRSREDAVRQGAPAAKQATGVREWLATVRPAPASAPVLAVFDTRHRRLHRWTPTAAPRAARLARGRGFDVSPHRAAFLVEDGRGPLLPRELDHAVTWIRSIAGAPQTTPDARVDPEDPR